MRRSEKSLTGAIKDDNLLVSTEECAMIALDKETIDDEENYTMILAQYI